MGTVVVVARRGARVVEVPAGSGAPSAPPRLDGVGPTPTAPIATSTRKNATMPPTRVAARRRVTEPGYEPPMP